MSHLSIKSLTKAYSGNAEPVLQSIDLEVFSGEIMALVGESGCGKTTLLRSIAGFVDPEEGSITMEGKILFSPKHSLVPEKRGIGLVFQDFALFPHMTVAQNIAYGLPVPKGKEANEKIKGVLALVGLPNMEKRYPHELSGGQQQRVAIARALAPSPGLLLLDEPFNNLDVKIKKEMLREVGRILRDSKTTAIFVTHSQKEAFSLSDRVAIMHQGVILQVDTPKKVYSEPANAYVADFFGGASQLDPERPLVRPWEIDLHGEEHPDAVEAQVTNVTFLGDHTEVECLTSHGHCVMIHRPCEESCRVGSNVYLRERNLGE